MSLKVMKYITYVVFITPLYFISNCQILMYVIGIFSNIQLNHILRGWIKQFPPREKKEYVRDIMEKYGKTLPYTTYEFPCEIIQNISYATGFSTSYFYDNYKYEREWVIYFIFIFALITVISSCILYKIRQNSIVQIISAWLIGLLMGCIFYTLTFFGNSKIPNNLW